MVKTNTISALLKGVKASLKEHSPEILTGIGIAGMITSTVLAVRATPKATRLLEAKKKELEKEKLSVAETVKTTWKCYIPAAVTTVSAAACIIGANSVHLKRNAALTAAYAISDKALREYQEKVVETIGEKKEHAVREAIAQDKIEKNPVSQNEVYITDTGTTLCYEPYTSRYFKSDIDRIKKAVNELNSQMLDEGTVTLNDFFYEIGLSNACVGDDLGWNYNRDRLVKLNLTSHLAEDGTPCVVVGFQVAPYYGYDKYY